VTSSSSMKVPTQTAIRVHHLRSIGCRGYPPSQAHGARLGIASTFLTTDKLQTRRTRP
jgi:hypothetical protein